MTCPRCNGELIETVKHGVVIDSCTSCGGVWLDKGELGKIISQMRKAEAELEEELKPFWKEKYYEKHKKKSPLEILFDIFD